VDDPKSVESALKIVESALKDERDILIACRELALLRSCLPSISDDVFDTFLGVASEVDDIPLGCIRNNWNDKKLIEKDNEAEHYREQVDSIVREALFKILEDLRMLKHAKWRH